MASEHGTWKRLGDGSLLTEDAKEGLGHIVPKQFYLNVLIALIFLTGITVWVADFEFGQFNVAVALLIASVKATLVGMFFMHLKWESKGILVVALYPILILVLFFAGTIGDAMTIDDPVVIEVRNK